MSAEPRREHGPLAGRRILITRAENDAVIWSRSLEALGAETERLPCIRCEMIEDQETIRILTTALAEAEWLVLTSARGVEAVDTLLQNAAQQTLRTIRIAVVGPTTAAAARQRFGRVDLVAAEGTARSLAIPLRAELAARPGSVLFAAADRARRDLEQLLTDAGIACNRVPVYTTVSARRAAETIDLTARQVDTILLASPSAVEGLAQLAELPADAEIYTIGPTTRRAVEEHGWVVTAEATEHSFDGLVTALIENTAADTPASKGSPGR